MNGGYAGIRTNNDGLGYKSVIMARMSIKKKKPRRLGLDLHKVSNCEGEGRVVFTAGCLVVWWVGWLVDRGVVQRE